MIFLLWAGGLAADDAAGDTSVYVGRAEESLVRGLDAIGTWQMTRSPDLIVMQCTDCSAPVTVVVRFIADYVGGTSFSVAQHLYDAGRHQLCSELVAQRRGKCLGDGMSLEEGQLIYEYALAERRSLLAGYVTADAEAPYTKSIAPIVREAVSRLSARY